MKLKEFDNKFQEYLSEMVGIANELIKGDSDIWNIYIYASLESEIYFFDAFYETKHKLAYTNEINDISSKKIDLPDYKILTMQRDGIDRLKSIKSLFESDQREIPTLLKMTYNTSTKAFNVDISYDFHFSNTNNRLEEDGFDEWFEEEKNKL